MLANSERVVSVAESGQGELVPKTSESQISSNDDHTGRVPKFVSHCTAERVSQISGTAFGHFRYNNWYDDNALGGNVTSILDGQKAEKAEVDHALLQEIQTDGPGLQIDAPALGLVTADRAASRQDETPVAGLDPGPGLPDAIENDLVPRRRSRSASSRSSSSDSDSSRDRRRRRKRHDKEERRKEKKERKREKRERKDRKKHKGKSGAVTGQWGQHGIINESHMYEKDAEFRTWLVEECKMNPESMSKDATKKQFARFVEDYNTATLPHPKFYNMETYERQMSSLRNGMTADVITDSYDLNADLAAHTSRHKRPVAEAETYLSKEQLQELRKVQNERTQAGKMKLLGMEIKGTMGVRMDGSEFE
ncbi:hypothetical protein RHS04_08154 [Rhizoctonia solani]|uniref:Uncharacterized protein n=1 Tax=Rhizoctonia solani TaxID=456999 RepID=A0A8H7LGP5_9AGAM|nr:hypothetical protein RHS04_08154 [Rhizoctonia solani]